MKKPNAYSLSEEIVNMTTHGAGLMMALAVCIVFIVQSAGSGTWLVPLSLSLYLFGVVSSYAASVVYHAIPSSRTTAKAGARKFDHAAIYWHIAGLAAHTRGHARRRCTHVGYSDILLRMAVCDSRHVAQFP